jgi:hypothetical protein
MTKLLSLATVRTGKDLPDPIICSFATELSSFGFFQRPVSIIKFVMQWTDDGQTCGGQKKKMMNKGKTIILWTCHLKKNACQNQGPDRELTWKNEMKDETLLQLLRGG